MTIELNLKNTIRLFKKALVLVLTMSLLAFLPQKLIASGPILTHTGNGCIGDSLKLYTGSGVVSTVWKRNASNITVGTTPVGYGITVAGNKAANAGSDSMHLDYPGGLCFDAAGNLYVADFANNRIQKWAPGAKYGVTVAGSEAGVAGTDSMHLKNPGDVRIDASGNLYIADAGNNRIQKWAPGANYGVTVAGSESCASGSDSLHFNYARALFLDASGNIYVTDLNNNRVQKWAVGKNYGVTVAGDIGGSSGTNAYYLNYPGYVFVDGNGDVYVADQHNNRVQEWKPGLGYGITVAGNSSGTAGTDSMLLYNPCGIFIDGNGNMYIGDTKNHRVQKWVQGASYGTTVAGNKNGVVGTDSLHLYYPYNVYVNNNGNIYIADANNNRIQEWAYTPDNYYVINAGGSYYTTVIYTNGDTITSDTVTISIPAANAGSNTSVCSGSSTSIGAAAISGHSYSWLSSPSGFTSTSANPSVSPTATTTYYLTESITATGCSNSGSVTVTVLLATGNAGSSQTICIGGSAAIGSAAVSGNTYSWTSSPAGFTSTAANPTVSPMVTTKYYLTESITASGCSISDSVSITVNPLVMSYTGRGCRGDSLSLNACTGVSKIIWKLDTTTLNVGTKPIGYGITVAGNKAGNIGTDSMHLNYPGGLCFDAAGNLYVADFTNNRVQKWAPGASYGITVAGSKSGISGTDSMLLYLPTDVHVDASGNIYVADYGNNRIQKWAPGAKYGVTVAGDKSGASGADSLHFNGARGLFLDASGNIYVSDLNNNRVQEWAVGKKYGITIAGNKAGTYGTDAYHLNYPGYIYVDGSGNLYVADQHNNRIQEWKSGVGYGSTVAGNSSGSYGTDSTLLFNPSGVYLDGNGNMYICDTKNYRVQKWAQGASYGTTVAGNKAGIVGNDSLHLYYPYNSFVDTKGNIYISDAGNNRIQEWGTTPNDFCIINAPGDYHATVYYSSGATEYSDTINANIPAANAGSNTSVCMGSSLSIGSTAIGGHTYSWVSSPSGFTSTSSNPSVSPTATTTYTLTESTTTGSCSNSNSVVVTVNPLPTATAGTSQAICSGGSASIGATAVGGDTYIWASKPSGYTAAASNIYVSPTAATTYYLTETITATGCSNSDSVTITVNPLPAANTGSNGAICSGGSTTIGSSAVSGNSYIWMSNPAGFSSTTSNPSVSPTITTTYYLGETITATGCGKYDSVIITVNPLPAANAGSSNAICPGNGVTIGASDVSGDTYSWTSIPAGFADANSSPSVSPSATTTYILVESISSTGCSNSNSVVVTVDTACKGYLTVQMDSTMSTFDTLHVKVYVNNAADVYALYSRLNINPDIFTLVNSTPGNFLGSSIIYLPAVDDNGYLDFGISKQGSQSGSSGTALFYSFTLVVKDTFPTVNVKSIFSFDSIVAYNASANSILIMDSGSKTIDVKAEVNVWPGDLNNDKVVNVSDLLPIGYFYNETGPLRPNASLNWTAQPATLWGNVKTNRNSSGWAVFADADGNGIVNLADVACIGFNMGQIHYKQAPVYVQPVLPQITNSSAPTLTGIFPDTMIPQDSLPKTIIIPVNIGSAGNSVPDLLGISITLSFNPKYVNTSSINLDFSNTIFGTSLQYSQITDSSKLASGELNIALTRRGKDNYIKNAFGNVVNLKFTIPANAPIGYFKFFSMVATSSDSNGNPLTLNSSVDSTHITTIMSSIYNIANQKFNLSVSPNPFTSNVSVSYTLSQSQNVRLTITDITGKQIATLVNENQNPGQHIYTLDGDKYNIPAGIYFIHLVSGGEVAVEKIVRVK